MNTQQEIHSSLFTTSHHRPDELIQQEVVWNLTQNGYLDGRAFSVSVNEGVVILQGEVPTRSQKKLAMECLQNVPGIVHIENRLKIKRVSRFRDEHSMHGF